MTYQFNVDVAQKLGVDEAVMLYNIGWWIACNRANERSFHEGRTWTYNSAAAFTKLFPFWSEKQIRRILDSLIAKKVLLVGCFNKNSYDHTRWFSLADEWNYLSEVNEKSDLPKREDGQSQSGRSQLPKPEGLYSDSKSDEKPDVGRAPRFIPPTIEECREEAKKVGLSEDEGDAFFDRHSTNGWIPSGQRTQMKDWHAAMRTWKRNASKFAPRPVNGKDQSNWTPEQIAYKKLIDNRPY